MGPGESSNPAKVDERPKVWVTGARGLIGSYLVQTAPQHAPEWAVQPISRNDFDLLDFGAVEQGFNADRPSCVIHCAAMSKNPVCEAEPKKAFAVNVEATRFLSEIAGQIGFIFFSTDLIFDGLTGGYVETDTPHPLSVYSETKVCAEEVVRRNPGHTILRISLNGGRSPTGDRGFNEEMQRAWKDGRTLTLFTDEFRCPMAAKVTAESTWELARKNVSGIYHLAGAEKLSRYQVGLLVAERHPELNPSIRPGTRRDYHGPPRPPDTSLDCSKVQQHLSFELPRFSDWLQENPHEPF